MDEEPDSVRFTSSGASMRTTFFRKRHKHPVEKATIATPTTLPSDIPSGKKKEDKVLKTTKKVVEVESGVELFEDTIPLTPPKEPANDTPDIPKKESKLNSEIPNVMGKDSIADNLDIPHKTNITHKDNGLSFLIPTQPVVEKIKLVCMALVKQLPIISLLALLIISLLPIHDFIRGVFSCLLGIAILESLFATLQNILNEHLFSGSSEKSIFEIPDYSKMSICEIPAAKEFKTVKVYEGWMNEIDSYDPNNFHMSMTKSVYVKLEGTILRISSTTTRVSKRAIWNETPVDTKKLIFIQHRTYNLAGCRIEMLPLGLAKKRYFNRKYPIQLIVQASLDTRLERDDNVSSKNNAKTSSSEKIDDQLDESFVNVENDMDFATTILQSDLKAFQESLHNDSESKDCILPCGDEVRLLIFARCDREKEDWYRRFESARTGEIYDQNLRLQNIKFITKKDLEKIESKAYFGIGDANVKPQENLENSKLSESTLEKKNNDSKTESLTETGKSIPEIYIEKKVEDTASTTNLHSTNPTEAGNLENDAFDGDENRTLEEAFEGLLMNSSVARNSLDYVRFMALYQKACSQLTIPVIKSSDHHNVTQSRRRQRHMKRRESDLWKGIDQSLFLGPSGSVVWANVIVGRLVYSCLKDETLHGKIKDFLQKKLSSVKLPNFMEDVIITQINLGDTPPLVHRVSQPMLDERGTWIDVDVTYEGHLDITVTTKLNLLRMRRPTPVAAVNTFNSGSNTPTVSLINNVPSIQIIPEDYCNINNQDLVDDKQLYPKETGSAIFDSDAESEGGSSSESESLPAGLAPEANSTNESNVFNNSPGNARRIFKIVDRIAMSNIFQYATELSYVQRAMENMSANITLRVELKGLVSRAVINIPPPPSDRVWLAFRGPPRLWISAKPAVGDKSFDWSIVTSVIENKLCEEVNKYLVYPNMVDIIIPFLGQSAYKK